VNAVWLFLHLLGFTLWLGGGMASMFAGIMARKEDRVGLGAVVRAQAAIHRTIIFSGALLTVLSGLILTFRISAGRTAGFNLPLVVMQGAGLIGALLALFVSIPTAAKLGRLDPVAQTAAFDELRARQRIIGSISGTLGLIALLAAALYRYGYGL
jgi:hypothetical protein